MKNFGIHFVTEALMVLLSVFCLISGVFAEEQTEDALSDLSLGELLNLEVSLATKTEMTLEEAPSIVSVITGDEIKNMGARNITDILRTVPGFDITHSINVPQSKIDIRGMGSWVNNKTKTLINGHAIATGYHLDHLPIANIRKIEIIRGPGSALYGAEAFLGVINIITKEGGDEPSRISLVGGSYGTIKPYAEFSYKKEGFKAYLYADDYTTDGYDGIIESDAATNSPVLASDTPGKMTEDSTHHTFQTRISYNGLSFSGFYQQLDTNNPVGVAKILADEDHADNVKAYGEIGYETPLKDRGTLHIRAYYDYTKWDNTWELFPEETAELEMHTGFPPGEGIYGRPLGKSSDLGGEMMADYELHPGIQTVAGVSYVHTKRFDTRSLANHNVTGSPVEVDGVIYPAFPFQYFPGGMTDISENANYNIDTHRDITALYGQGIFDLKELFSLERSLETLSFTAGIRYDDYDDIGSTANPRFGIVWAPTASLYFKALYGTAFRAPSFGELYIKNNPATIGNENLNPEQITTMEMLVGYNFTKNIRSSLTCFKISTEDLIQKIDKKWENIGEMESLGLEAEVKINFDKLKYAYCNFTWQDVKNTTQKTISSSSRQVYTQEDFNPGSIPEFYGNIGINADITEYMIANVSLNYVGKRERSEEKKWEGENLVRTDNRDPVKARTLLNASLTFRNIIKGMELQVSGFNLLDEDHRVPDPAGALYDDLPRAGRSFTGRISYSF